jgi:hypothetical protein
MLKDTMNLIDTDTPQNHCHDFQIHSASQFIKLPYNDASLYL